MRHSIAPVALALAVLAVTGCASFPQQPYNRVAHAKVQTIAIVSPALPEKPSAWMAVHPGQSFGLIGGLIAAGDTASKTNALADALNKQGFDHHAAFVAALSASLVEAGYKVTLLDAQRPNTEFLAAYPDLGGADAILDTYSGSVGYMSAGASTPYRPTAWVAARMVTAGESRTVFADQIFVNAFGNPRDAITLEAPSGYAFASFDNLVADPARTADGLSLALKTVAAEIARQLR